MQPGIGQTDGEEHSTNERDADGRLAWNFGKQKPGQSADGKADVKDDAVEAVEQPLSRDLSGDSGGALDLVG